jgi:phosphoribosylanthranilate isomerase
VFVDEPAELMAKAYRRLGLLAVQIHGSTQAAVDLMGPEVVIPAVAIRDAAQAVELAGLNPRHPAVLADSFSAGAHGGTGKVFNHELVRPLTTQRPLLIAGGLGPDNIFDVVSRLGREHQPYAYDLSSGVEATPGVKDHGKLRRFFAEFERATASLAEGGA